MAGETSSPGGQDTIDQAEEENMMADMTAAQSQAAMSEAGLSMGFGDFAGSSSLASQGSSNLLGSNLVDALVPGVGTLSLISKFSGNQLQQQLQQGASPVYGPGGVVVGTLGTGLFGGKNAYSGNPDYDPNRSEPDGSSDSGNVSTRKTVAGRPGRAVKGVSNTTSARITPSAAVRGPSLAPKLYAMSSRGKGRGVNTSPQGILGSAPVQRKTLLGT
jgi:hypothetical protein